MQSGGLAETEPSGETGKITDTVEETPREPKASNLKFLLQDMRTEEPPKPVLATTPKTND